MAKGMGQWLIRHGMTLYTSLLDVCLFSLYLTASYITHYDYIQILVPEGFSPCFQLKRPMQQGFIPLVCPALYTLLKSFNFNANTAINNNACRLLTKQAESLRTIALSSNIAFQNFEFHIPWLRGLMAQDTSLIIIVQIIDIFKENKLVDYI